jgi:hypothetical protein
MVTDNYINIIKLVGLHNDLEKEPFRALPITLHSAFVSLITFVTLPFFIATVLCSHYVVSDAHSYACYPASDVCFYVHVMGRVARSV